MPAALRHAAFFALGVCLALLAASLAFEAHARGAYADCQAQYVALSGVTSVHSVPAAAVPDCERQAAPRTVGAIAAVLSLGGIGTSAALLAMDRQAAPPSVTCG